MNNINLIKLFDKAVFLSKGTRIQRLMKSPIKLPFSKFLAIVALLFEKSFRIEVKTFWGEKMLVILPEVVSLSIYRYGLFEEGLSRMVLEHLKTGMTFFDIGAHFGYFTLLSSFIVGNKGQVHAFEPTPSSFSILKSNISNKDNVVLNNSAVLSKRKIVFINDYDIKYSAFNSIYNARLPQDILPKLKVKKHEVQSVSIDDYVENNSIIPNFIKIDAEGSEYEILIGMEKTIHKFKPIITIEVGDMGVKDVPASKDLINFLVNKGYKCYEFKEGKILQQALKDKQYQYDNILFLPS